MACVVEEEVVTRSFSGTLPSDYHDVRIDVFAATGLGGAPATGETMGLVVLQQ